MTKPRIVFFTHDTYGLGHLSRCLHLIRALAERVPQAPLLLISGSPVVGMFQSLPPNADYVKVPTIVKTGEAESQPPHLPLSHSEITWLRSQIIHQTATRFDPDVFVVDNFPLGSRSELLPTLKDLKRSKVRMILGLRDILDSPDVIQTEWKKQGIYEVLDRYYDQILIYGSRKVFDVVRAYAIPERIVRKIVYCGYLTSTSLPAISPEKIRRELGVRGQLAVVTGGGGGDAFPLISTFLEALPLLSNTTALVVTGPMMGASDRSKLQKLAAGNSNVIFREFVPDLRSYMNAADVVVSMCGYNIAAEILVLRRRAVLVPRNWKYGQHLRRTHTMDEREQVIRARSLSSSGLALLLEPNNLTAQRLAEKIQEALQLPEPETSTGFDVGGLEAAVELILTQAAMNAKKS